MTKVKCIRSTLNVSNELTFSCDPFHNAASYSVVQQIPKGTSHSP